MHAWKGGRDRYCYNLGAFKCTAAFREKLERKITAFCAVIFFAYFEISILLWRGVP